MAKVAMVEMVAIFELRVVEMPMVDCRINNGADDRGVCDND